MSNGRKKMIDPLNDKQYRALKRAYVKAVEEKVDQFEFEESPILITFAKYLLQHIENIREARSLSILKIKPKVEVIA